jgi:hypothetical protein
MRGLIKTDASISGWNSGARRDHTASCGHPDAGRDVDARRIQDTNGDGIFDDQDTPVAIGGFINHLRPVNLAYPLIEEAMRDVLGSGDEPPTTPRRRRSQETPTAATFSEFGFCSK